jgi:hypothetical protein
MKRCPSCQRTYDDNTQTFCFTDGARLVEEGQAYDSQKTMVAPPPAQQPEPTQYYRPEQPPASAYPAYGNQSPAWPPQHAAQPGAPGWPAQAAPPQQQTPSWGAPPPSPSQPGAAFVATNAPATQDRRRGLGIAALLLGILSIQNAIFNYLGWVEFYTPIRRITLIMALIGLILGTIGLRLSMTNAARHAGRNLAVAGIITGIVSILLLTLRGRLF